MQNQRIILILRAAQLFFTIVVLGLTAYLTYLATSPSSDCFTDYLGYTTCGSYVLGEPPVVGFLLFTSVWSLLVIVALAGVSFYVQAMNHPIAATVLDGLTTIFWFSAAVAVAVPFAGPGDAIGDADIAMAFIAFGLFVATFVLNILRVVRGEDSSSHRHKENNSQNPELEHI